MHDGIAGHIFRAIGDGFPAVSGPSQTSLPTAPSPALQPSAKSVPSIHPGNYFWVRWQSNKGNGLGLLLLSCDPRTYPLIVAYVTGVLIPLYSNHRRGHGSLKVSMCRSNCHDLGNNIPLLSLAELLPNGKWVCCNKWSSCANVETRKICSLIFY